MIGGGRAILSRARFFLIEIATAYGLAMTVEKGEGL